MDASSPMPAIITKYRPGVPVSDSKASDAAFEEVDLAVEPLLLDSVELSLNSEPGLARPNAIRRVLHALIISAIATTPKGTRRSRATTFDVPPGHTASGVLLPATP